MKKFLYVLAGAVLIVLGVMFFGSKEQGNQSEARVSTVALKSVSNTASPLLVDGKVITWETDAYPKEAGVNINLLKMVSDSPRTFEAVRTIAMDTPNDGEETWAPKEGETADNIYIEVTCSSTYLFESGCQVTGEMMKVNQ